MLGKKFIKPVSDWDEYAKTADWCNANNAYIVEREDCYEVVAIPAPTFEELRERKLAELSASFEERVSGSFTTSQGYVMQFDRADSLAVQGMIELLEATGHETGYLTQADDTTVYDIPLATIKAVLIEMLAAYAACHEQKQEYRKQINDCVSVYELDKIEFKWEV